MTEEIVHPDAIARVQQNMLPEDEYTAAAELFKRFGDTTRLRILHYLQFGELCVTDLSSLLGITKSAVSHQLADLRLSKLIRVRRDGKNIYYSLSDDHVSMIMNVGLEHLRED